VPALNFCVYPMTNYISETRSQTCSEGFFLTKETCTGRNHFLDGAHGLRLPSPALLSCRCCPTHLSRCFLLHWS